MNIYADNAATTRIDPAVLEAMEPFTKEEYANASQPYSFSRKAKAAIKNAREEIAKCGLDKEINQYFAVLTNLKSVGVMGDERTYDYTVALRAVTTSDFMTASWSKIPFEVLETVSSRIVNEVKHVNRVVYDITGKPPATIEWE